MTNLERSNATSSAAVVAGSVYTSYTRWGQGPPLLLLSGEADAQPLPDEVAARVGEAFTMIVPDGTPWTTAEPGVAFSSWLRDFLDGLGIERVSILAGSHHGPRALAFAQLEPDRVTRLVLIAAGGPQPRGGTTLLPDRLERARVQLLTVAGDGGVSGVAVGLAALLSGGSS